MCSHEIKLTMSNQPFEYCQLRYPSEGSPCLIRGQTPNSYPEIELEGFNGTAYIQCSLYHVDEEFSNRIKLFMIDDKGKEIVDRLFIKVSSNDGYTAEFKGLYLYLCDEQEKGNKSTRAKPEKQMKNIKFVLRFDAFQENFHDGSWKKLCEPFLSNFIFNKKKLNIYELSIAGSPVDGGKKLILLVKNVLQNEIEVEFFNQKPDGEVWTSKGVITKVHYQNAIVLNTPPYFDLEITKYVDVFIHLKRGNEYSDPVPFMYTPRKYLHDYRKRKRFHSGLSPEEEVLINECLECTPNQILRPCSPDLVEFVNGILSGIVNGIGKDGHSSEMLPVFNPYLNLRPNKYNELIEKLTKIPETGIDTICNNLGQSALHLACHYNNHEFVKSLIESGCNPNLQDSFINTALHIAVQNNYIKCIEVLLNQEFYKTNSITIDVKLRNNDGLTSLHLAIENKDLNTVKLIMENDKDSVETVVITNGNNALHCAIEGDNYDIVKYILLKTNINVNAYNLSKQTPLGLAQSINPESKISQLLATVTTQ